MDNNTLIKKLFVVGIGPGNIEDMTIRAHRILSECDVIAGYTVYCDLVRPFFADKEYLSTPMMGEEKRVRLAFEAAEKGKKVAVFPVSENDWMDMGQLPELEKMRVKLFGE